MVNCEQESSSRGTAKSVIPAEAGINESQCLKYFRNGKY